jgi:hypothetical protein
VDFTQIYDLCRDERGSAHVALEIRCVLRILRNMDTSDATSCREDSPSHSSSLGAVHAEPIRPPRGGGRWLTRDTPLPGFIAPETPLQKRMRLELGEVGPLTAIQEAQIAAYRLRRRIRYHADEENLSDSEPAPPPCLSHGRWERICEWRRALPLSDFDTKWDASVRRELEQEALRQRALMYA